MQYPHMPKNRLIVGGVDLTQEFKMVLEDGYTLEPPEPKTYTVDVPYADGSIDLTESLYGDVAYNNRNQEFTFYVIDDQNVEQTKTKVSNFLHGKAFDYQMTMDPGYTYHGRFKVSSYTHATYPRGFVTCIKITVDAEPYKKKPDKIYKINANGGKIIRLESGRKRVQPTFECSNPTVIGFGDKEYLLPQGSYKCPDVWFTQGWNELYVNSWKINTLTWNELDSLRMAWNDAERYRWFELEKYGTSGDISGTTWDELCDFRWDELANKTWNDIEYSKNGGRKSETYIAYEWSDL